MIAHPLSGSLGLTLSKPVKDMKMLPENRMEIYGRDMGYTGFLMAIELTTARQYPAQ